LGRSGTRRWGRAGHAPGRWHWERRAAGGALEATTLGAAGGGGSARGALEAGGRRWAAVDDGRGDDIGLEREREENEPRGLSAGLP
jgi:hypothetical protein